MSQENQLHSQLSLKPHEITDNELVGESLSSSSKHESYSSSTNPFFDPITQGTSAHTYDSTFDDLEDITLRKPDALFGTSFNPLSNDQQPHGDSFLQSAGSAGFPDVPDVPDGVHSTSMSPNSPVQAMNFTDNAPITPEIMTSSPIFEAELPQELNNVGSSDQHTAEVNHNSSFFSDSIPHSSNVTTNSIFEDHYRALSQHTYEIDLTTDLSQSHGNHVEFAPGKGTPRNDLTPYLPIRDDDHPFASTSTEAGDMPSESDPQMLSSSLSSKPIHQSPSLSTSDKSPAIAPVAVAVKSHHGHIPPPSVSPSPSPPLQPQNTYGQALYPYTSEESILATMSEIFQDLSIDNIPLRTITKLSPSPSHSHNNNSLGSPQQKSNLMAPPSTVTFATPLSSTYDLTHVAKHQVSHQKAPYSAPVKQYFHSYNTSDSTRAAPDPTTRENSLGDHHEQHWMHHHNSSSSSSASMEGKMTDISPRTGHQIHLSPNSHSTHTRFAEHALRMNSTFNTSDTQSRSRPRPTTTSTSLSIQPLPSPEDTPAGKDAPYSLPSPILSSTSVPTSTSTSAPTSTPQQAIAKSSPSRSNRESEAILAPTESVPQPFDFTLPIIPSISPVSMASLASLLSPDEYSQLQHELLLFETSIEHTILSIQRQIDVLHNTQHDIDLQEQNARELLESIQDRQLQLISLEQDLDQRQMFVFTKEAEVNNQQAMVTSEIQALHREVDQTREKLDIAEYQLQTTKEQYAQLQEYNTELKYEMAQQKTLIHRLQEDVKQYSSALKTLQTEHHHLTTTAAAQKESYTTLLHQHKEVMSELESSRDHQRQIEREAHATQSSYEILQSKFQLLQQTHQHLVKDYDAVHASLSETLSQTTPLQQQLDHSTTVVKKLEDDIEQLQRNYTVLHDKYTTLETDYQSAIDAKNKAMQEYETSQALLQDAQKRVQYLEHERLQLERELYESTIKNNTSLQAKADELYKLRVEMSTKLREIEAMWSTRYQEMITRQTSVNSISPTQGSAAFRSHQNRSNSSPGDSADHQDESKDEENTTQLEYASIHQKYHDLLLDLSELQQRYQLLDGRFQRQKAHLDSIQQRNKVLVTTLHDDYKAQIVELETALTAQKQAMNEIELHHQQEISGLQRELQRIKTQSSQLDYYYEQYTKLQDEHTKISSKNVQLETDLSDMTRKYHAEQQLNQELRTNLSNTMLDDDAIQQLAVTSPVYLSLLKQYNEMKSHLDKHTTKSKAEMTKLSNENTYLADQLAQSEQRQSALQEECSELSTKYTSLSKEHHQLQHQYTTLDGEKTRALQQIDELTSYVSELEQRLQQHAHAVTQEQQEALNHQVKQLQSDNARLQHQYETSQQYLNDLRLHVNDMSTQRQNENKITSDIISSQQRVIQRLRGNTTDDDMSSSFKDDMTSLLTAYQQCISILQEASETSHHGEVAPLTTIQLQQQPQPLNATHEDIVDIQRDNVRLQSKLKACHQTIEDYMHRLCEFEAANDTLNNQLLEIAAEKQRNTDENPPQPVSPFGPDPSESPSASPILATQSLSLLGDNGDSDDDNGSSGHNDNTLSHLHSSPSMSADNNSILLNSSNNGIVTDRQPSPHPSSEVVEQLRLEIVHLKEELLHMEQHANELTHQNADLINSLEQSRQHTAHVETERSLTTAAYEKIQSKYAQLETTIQSLNMKLQDTLHENEQLQIKLDECHAELLENNATLQKSQMDQQLEHQEELRELTTQIDSLTQLQQQLSTQLEDSQQVIDKITRELLVLRGERDDLVKQLHESHQTIADLHNQQHSRNSQLATEPPRSSPSPSTPSEESFPSRLPIQQPEESDVYKLLKSQYNQSKKTINILQNNNLTLSQSLQDLETERNDALQRVMKSEDNILLLQQQLTAVQAGYEQRILALTDAHSQEVIALQKERDEVLQSLNARIQSLMGDITQKDQALAQLMSSIDSQTHTIASLEEHITQLQTTLDAQQAAKEHSQTEQPSETPTTASTSDENHQIESLQQQIASHKTTLLQLKKDYEEDLVRQLKLAKQGFQHKFDQFKQDILDKTKHKASILHETYQDKIKQLQDSHGKSIEQLHRDYRAEIHELQQAIKSHTVARDDHDNGHRSIEDQIATATVAYTHEIDTLSAQLVDVQSELAAMKTTLSEYQQELASIDHQHDNKSNNNMSTKEGDSENKASENRERHGEKLKADASTPQTPPHMAAAKSPTVDSSGASEQSPRFPNAAGVASQPSSPVTTTNIGSPSAIHSPSETTEALFSNLVQLEEELHLAQERNSELLAAIAELEQDRHRFRQAIQLLMDKVERESNTDGTSALYALSSDSASDPSHTTPISHQLSWGDIFNFLPISFWPSSSNQTMPNAHNVDLEQQAARLSGHHGLLGASNTEEDRSSFVAAPHPTHTSSPSAVTQPLHGHSFPVNQTLAILDPHQQHLPPLEETRAHAETPQTRQGWFSWLTGGDLDTDVEHSDPPHETGLPPSPPPHAAMMTPNRQQPQPRSRPSEILSTPMKSSNKTMVMQLEHRISTLSIEVNHQKSLKAMLAQDMLRLETQYQQKYHDYEELHGQFISLQALVQQYQELLYAFDIRTKELQNAFLHLCCLIIYYHPSIAMILENNPTILSPSSAVKRVALTAESPSSQPFRSSTLDASSPITTPSVPAHHSSTIENNHMTNERFDSPQHLFIQSLLSNDLHAIVAAHNMSPPPSSSRHSQEHDDSPGEDSTPHHPTSSPQHNHSSPRSDVIPSPSIDTMKTQTESTLWSVPYTPISSLVSSVVGFLSQSSPALVALGQLTIHDHIPSLSWVDLAYIRSCLLNFACYGRHEGVVSALRLLGVDMRKSKRSPEPRFVYYPLNINFNQQLLLTTGIDWNPQHKNGGDSDQQHNPSEQLQSTTSPTSKEPISLQLELDTSADLP